jgi:exopolysaccharide production protein ExoZ
LYWTHRNRLPFEQEYTLIFVVIIGAVALSSIGIFGTDNAAAYLSQPIILLFPLGMAVGLLRRMFISLSPITDCAAVTISVAIIAVAVLAIDLTATHDIGAWLIVAAVATVMVCAFEVRKRVSLTVEKIALSLGAATYAIYLTHTFFIPSLARVAGKIGLSQHYIIFALLMLPIATIVGHLIYILGEKHMIKATAKSLGSGRFRVVEQKNT